ncbi:hypothetical protein QWY28_01165 [Nocardioides sp. SOB77]|uniref:Neutral metalloprotease n=1 Tax=Nocardioides oceani TaxID=3058369 RepID=A0ABT8FA24_9ACTN|nr:MXAN_6640 family putative metalloprotease [Nocardioides oceani]MDN4171544.1 hypothetical protein [Nocardioides oceani]
MPRTRPSRPFGRTLVVGLLALAVALVPGLAGATPTAGNRTGQDAGASRPATYAADAASRRAAAGRLAAARSALAGDGRDATEALRQLRMARSSLDRADRRAADRLLARPASRKRSCTVVCVHWSTSGRHRATTAWAKRVLAITGSVHRTLTTAGYRSPKADGTVGGNAKTDVYVQDLDDGLYGYCTSDQKTKAFDVWAYCVVDNDYRGFPTGTPLQNLQVTVAHEYFHAVQFAYDSYEDTWLLEGSAAWVEEALFDAVDDNRQYLSSSPLSHPGRPMDRSGGTFHYGTWLFFEHLAGVLPEREGGLPVVVRDIWRAADARKGAPDLHSTDAVSAVLEAAGTDLPSTFAGFATANRRPAEWYAEGSATEYDPAPAAETATLALGAPTTWSPRVDHLTSATLAAKPPASATSAAIVVDLPASGAVRAVATVVLTDGTSSSYLIPLDGAGHGTATAPFAAGSVIAVEVTVANADVRYECWQRTDFACGGRPLGDGQGARVQVTAR